MDTLYRDLQSRILIEIDFEFLHNMCATSPDFYKICNDENLWIARIEREFGRKYLKNKPVEFSYKDYYGDLWLFTSVGWNIDDYIKDGYWDPKPYVWSELINYVVATGRLFLIQYAFSFLQLNSFTIHSAFRLASFYNSLDIAEYIWKHYKNIIIPQFKFNILTWYNIIIQKIINNNYETVDYILCKNIINVSELIDYMEEYEGHYSESQKKKVKDYLTGEIVCNTM